MKKILTTIAVLTVAAALFAGDAASFVDLGFSKDGKTYVFGQYGKTDVDFNGYAEIYTVDVKKNDFVSNGVFKSVDKSGKSGQRVFSSLKDKQGSFLKKYTLSPVDADSILYMREDSSKSGLAEITFKDYGLPAGSQEVFYTVRLVPNYVGMSYHEIEQIEDLIIETKYAPSEEDEKDIVLEQSLAAMQKLA